MRVTPRIDGDPWRWPKGSQLWGREWSFTMSYPESSGFLISARRQERLWDNRIVTAGILRLTVLSFVTVNSPEQSIKTITLFHYPRDSPGAARWPRSLRTLGTRLGRFANTAVTHTFFHFDCHGYHCLVLDHTTGTGSSRPINQLAESPHKTHAFCIPAYGYTPGGDSHMKGTRMLVGKLELKP